LLRCRWQADQIETQSTNQCRAIGFWRKGQLFFVKLLKNEGVDLVSTIDFRNRHSGLDGFLKSPVTLVFGTLLDPSTDHIDFLRPQWRMMLGRRHHVIGILRENPMPCLRGLDISRNNRSFA
jgi:hypothetical protein